MIGWLDTASGASGDMLLGAVLHAGADLDLVRRAVAAVSPEAAQITPEPVVRGGLAATHAVVVVAESLTHRGLGDVLRLIRSADLDDEVATHATAVFTALAEAEAKVHAVAIDDVHFHEVGALDAISDIVGVCAGLASLQLEALHCTAVAVGSGTVNAAHGRLSVPVPAVVELLRGIPTYAGPAATELCTPTGAALLRHWVTSWGSQPPMVVKQVGVGAGSKDLPGLANVVRLLVGEPLTSRPDGAGETALVVETNVDDLDPRLWPSVLDKLLAAGAADAWLTPILMKKGRPASTLSVLTKDSTADAVRAVVFAETSAIGLREFRVGKRELAREFHEVEVGGRRIRVKVARAGGRVVNVQPEYEDVVDAATALDCPAKVVLAEATGRAAWLWTTDDVEGSRSDGR